MRTLTRSMVWALALLTAAVSAQTPTRDTRPIPTGAGGISGVVVAGTKPLRLVSVSIAGDMKINRTTITDDEGRFAFSKLPTGRYTLSATKGGYVKVAYGATRPNRPGTGLFLKDDQQIANLVLKMLPGAVITGTLYDERGQPLPNASVTAYVTRTSITGQVDLTAMARSRSAYPVTDDRGVFRFYGLSPGDYIVGTTAFFRGFGNEVLVPTDAELRAAFLAATQSAPGTNASPALANEASKAPAPAEHLVNYAPTYFGDAVDPLSASRVTLAAGEERTGVDLHLRLAPTGRIAGVVMGPNGPASSPSIQLVHRTSIASLTLTTFFGGDADGTFSWGSLAPGDYALFAQTRDAQSMWALAELTLDGRDVTGLTMTLQPALQATGRIMFEGETLKPPADFSTIGINLNSVYSKATAALPDVRIQVTPVTAAGDFTAKGFVPGSYSVLARVSTATRPGEPAWSLKSVTLGGRDVTDLPMLVGNGEVIPPITITFTDRSTELSGSLQTGSGQPATDYFMIAFPADRQYWMTFSRRVKSVRPDVNGHYVFTGLPPGSYRLAATTDLESSDLQDMSFLEALVAASATVTIGEGEKKTFDLRLGGGALGLSRR